MSTVDDPTANKVEEEEEEQEEINPLLLKPDLYAAAFSNDLTKVKELLDLRVPATFIDIKNGMTPLHCAVINDNSIMLKALLESNASEPYHRLKGKYMKEKQKQRQENNDKTSGNGVGKVEEYSAEEKDEGLTKTQEEIEIDGPLAEGDEEEDEENIERALEVSIDLTINTPLLWSITRGNLRNVWILLNYGYSPNDLDPNGNNGLHLAAALGDPKMIRVLIDDGARSNVVNIYKNHAIDMAKNKEIRDILQLAQVSGASITEADIVRKHEENIQAYKNKTETLTAAIAEAATTASPSNYDGNMVSTRLIDAIEMATAWAVEDDLIERAKTILKQQEITHELLTKIINVEKQSPINTQMKYIEHVTKLEKVITISSGLNIDEKLIDHAKQLVRQKQLECWLCIHFARLADVEIAMSVHEHDMNRLRKVLSESEKENVDGELLESSKTLMKRLDAELGMSRALETVPEVRLPIDNPPIDYWQEDDKGHVVETENYPMPPLNEEGKPSDYVWEESKALLSLKAAYKQLQSSFTGAEELGANPEIIEKSRIVLVKCEKEIKLLEAKNEADKVACIEAVKKMAKKLKKKKK